MATSPAPSDPASLPTHAPAGPAWTAADLQQNPHVRADKPARVRAMFAAIAESYDLNNRLHSLGRDQAWRRYAVRAADVTPGAQVLDVACGTGDLTEAFARSAAAHVIGVDFTAEMLDIARRKQPRRLPAVAAAKVSYEQGDAMALRFPDAQFDVVSIAFGIRNVLEPARALSEFARVLKPGGRLIVLEFDRPGWFPARQLNDLYCGWIMPRTATWISGDRSGAYRYLPKSVGTFMARAEMRAALERAGFAQVSARALTLGICVCYRGVKPS